jgi:tetratricopeptide (TPR) repeat protein
MTPRTVRCFVRFATALALVALATGCSREGRKAGIIKKADEYFAAGEFDRAEIEYKNVIQVGGLDPHAIGRLGILYLEQGRGARAFSYLVKANEIDPANLEVRTKLALIYAAGGKLNEARDAALFVLEKRPADPEAPTILAEIAAQPREVIEARARLQALPPTAASLSALALLDLRERKLPAAQTLLNRALELDPKFATALSTLARVYWAQNDLVQADERFAAAVAAAPARSTIRLHHARFKLNTGKADAAKALLDESIAKTPDYLPAYLLRATIATSEKKHEESVALYEKVLARDSEHPEALIMIGQERLALGANDKALAALEKAAATFPGAGQVHFQLGNAYQTSGNLPKAAASLAEAVRLQPGVPGPIVALARPPPARKVRSGGRRAEAHRGEERHQRRSQAALGRRLPETGELCRGPRHLSPVDRSVTAKCPTPLLRRRALSPAGEAGGSPAGLHHCKRTRSHLSSRGRATREPRRRREAVRCRQVETAEICDRQSQRIGPLPHARADRADPE